MLYCFLDTNVLLQYQMFDEINWTKVLQAKKVCLVIPRQVIRELDNHKNHSTSKRVKNRSRIVIRKIAEYTDQDGGTVRKSVLLQVQTDAPTQKWLEDNSYNPTDGDDRIVGEVHYFIQNVKQDTDDVILVAEDYGARIKAKASGVPQMEPPAELRLEDEPDPVEKENRELEKEVARLKHIQPKLSMKFQDEKGNLLEQIQFEVDFTESQISNEEIEQEVRKNYEILKYDDQIDESKEEPNGGNQTLKDAMRLLGRSLVTLPTQNDVEIYHNELLDYLKGEFSEYLKKQQRFVTLERRLRTIQLVLENSGTTPAENIDVSMHFPDGFLLREHKFQKPDTPKPPTKLRPKGIHEDLYRSSLSDSMLYSMPSRMNSTPPPVKPSRPPMSIRKTNSYEIVHGKDSLKHHFNWRWRPLFLYFDPIEENKTGYEITYSITANNLPDIVEGKLILILKKS